MALSVFGADRAGRIDYSAQFGDLGCLALHARRRDLDVSLQPGRETAGEAFAERLVERYEFRELRRPVRLKDHDLPGRLHHSGLAVVVDSFSPKHPTLVASLDAPGGDDTSRGL